MLGESFLRRKAIEATLKGLRVPARYVAPVAEAVNRFLEKAVLTGLLQEAREEVSMSGWKTALGGFIKTAGMAAASSMLPALLDAMQHAAAMSANTKLGLILGLVATVGGDALQKIGLGHKQERTIEAVKENTAAVETAAATPAPVVVVAPAPILKVK